MPDLGFGTSDKDGLKPCKPKLSPQNALYDTLCPKLHFI